MTFFKRRQTTIIRYESIDLYTLIVSCSDHSAAGLSPPSGSSVGSVGMLYSGPRPDSGLGSLLSTSATSIAAGG